MIDDDDDDDDDDGWGRRRDGGVILSNPPLVSRLVYVGRRPTRWDCFRPRPRVCPLGSTYTTATKRAWFSFGLRCSDLTLCSFVSFRLFDFFAMTNHCMRKARGAMGNSRRG
jgi:hypothetical protein